MWTALLVLAVIVAVLLLVRYGGSALRSSRDASEAQMRKRADLETQFKRPPDEGGLL